MARDKTDKTDTTPAATLATTATRGRKISYIDAVRRAKGLLENPNTEPRYHYEHMQSAFGAYEISRKPHNLVANAQTDAESHDLLRLGIAEALSLEPGAPWQKDFADMRDDIRAWLIDYLRGNAPRPKGKAGALDKRALHQRIHIVVAGLVLDGMNATRNDASEPTSACDAVADALAELGLEPATFHGVKRVWLDFQKTQSHE